MTDIFEGDNPTLTNGEGSNHDHGEGHDTDPNLLSDDPLAELVGEGKKYKTTADLVRAIQEKDSFIERLKSENGGMREDLANLQAKLEQSTKLDDVLNKMTASRGSESNQSFSDDEVRKIVDAALEERMTEAKQRENVMAASKAVVDYLNGDTEKAKQFVAEKAQALGMSVSDLLEVARKSPTGFAQLVGVQTKAPAPGAPSARSSESISNYSNEPKQGTKAYYDHLRRTNPAAFWSQKVQNQMIKDAQQNPERFYGK